MSDWLDLIGSFAIGGLILLIIINLNLTVNTAATQNLYSNVTQRQVVASVEVIENDIYKIGYRIDGAVLTIADSSEIQFVTDINNDGINDKIRYYLTETSSLNGTYNPDDRILWRDLNDESSLTPFIVTELNFSYYDSLGQIINYSSLLDQSNRDRVKIIKVIVETETGELIDGEYQTIQWEKLIRPKNI